jgi:hypothetical protein
LQKSPLAFRTRGLSLKKCMAAAATAATATAAKTMEMLDLHEDLMGI